MARHPRIEACMFCMAFPCECEQEVKKPAPRKRAAKKESASSDTAQNAESSIQIPTGPSTLPTVDIHAAMKAAAQQAPATEQKTIMETKPRWSTTDQKLPEPEDAEFVEAVNVLEPILHPTEKRKHSEILNRPESRASRWKARNNATP